MVRVITYGTFDLIHQGHINILKRAKELGDYLIVGDTGEEYDIERGKLNVIESLNDRIENVRKTGLADQIIVEQYEGQKISDIQKYKIDLFVIGSDWKGKFDFLKEFCEVSYLERTKDISSTQLRINKHKILNIGIAGSGNIANRFIAEAKYVSGCNVFGVYSRNIMHASDFAKNHELEYYTGNYHELIDKCDIIYIATPHHVHYTMTKLALLEKKHVLCEKPITLSVKELKNLYEIADKNNVVLFEGIKTAYTPGFIRLIDLAKFEIIGKIYNIDATFTKLINKNSREYDIDQAGGSLNEFGSYPLLAIEKLLGHPNNILYQSIYENNVDIFTKAFLEFDNAFATIKVGIGVKAEGDLIISGNKGYIYVPAPWWKTQEFEIRFENSNLNKKYFFKFEGDGLRYEIAELIKIIHEGHSESWLLTRKNSLNIVNMIEQFNNKMINRD